MYYRWATPLWTVDLFFFLKERGLDAVMSTSVIGINETHENLEWYKHLDEDSKRVNHLFEKARTNGWDIDDVVTTPDLIELLQAQNKKELPYERTLVAIVLVDNNTLHSLDDDSYSGHYILVIGFDCSSDEVLYLDPALGSQIQRISELTFDNSRQSSGTDHDLILITRGDS